MRGMGGIVSDALRGMVGVHNQPMGEGIKRGKKIKYESGLLFISRQTTNAVQATRIGDLIIACLRRDGSGPSLASGWTIIKNGFSNAVTNIFTAYKFATTADAENPNGEHTIVSSI